MKILTSLTIASFLFSLSTFAQKTPPVSWTFQIEKVDESTYDLVATANMDEKWVIYSQHTDPDGPIPTYFEFEEGSIKLLGDVNEKSESISKFSDLFEVDVVKFKGQAVFVQRFESSDSNPKVKGTVTYMTCDSKRCLPPTDVLIDVSL